MRIMRSSRHSVRFGTRYVTSIGSWNTQSLNSPGKDHLLAQELDRYSIPVCALQETHWPGSGLYSIPNSRYTVYFSGRTDKRHAEGVGFAVHSDFVVNEFKPISNRLCYVILNCTAKQSVGLICVYAPTNVANAQVSDE